MVFWFKYCSDLLWEKNCSCDREELLKFNAEGQEFTKILRSLEQFKSMVKGQYNFWNRMLFELVPGGFLDQLWYKLENIIGNQKPTEKVRKD